jgi:MoxR-like ATPase
MMNYDAVPETLLMQPYDLANWRSKHQFVDEHDYVSRASLYLFGDKDVKGSGNLAAKGPKGAGKDHLAQQLSEDNKALFLTMTCTPDMSVWDYLGAPKEVNEKLTFLYGFLPSLCIWAHKNPERAVIGVIDELNMGPPGAHSPLNSFTDSKRAVTIPFTGDVVTRPENAKLIVTFNPWDQSGYAGTQQLNIALLDRFDAIDIDYLGEFEETKLLVNYNKDLSTCSKWAAFAAKTRMAYKNGELPNVVTTRQLINWVQYAKRQKESYVLELALAQFPDDYHKSVKSFFGGMTQ